LIEGRIGGVNSNILFEENINRRRGEMTDKSSDKRLIGALFPFIILAYVGVIYYGVFVRLYFLKNSSL